jgi:hypothetical protein
MKVELGKRLISKRAGIRTKNYIIEYKKEVKQGTEKKMKKQGFRATCFLSPASLCTHKANSKTRTQLLTSDHPYTATGALIAGWN